MEIIWLTSTVSLVAMSISLFLQFGSNKFCSATHGIIPPLSVFGPRTYLEHFI
jgi:hypothetical protein